MESEEIEGAMEIDRHEFFFELPLYETVDLENLEEDFWDFMKGDVDAYSPDGFDTTYSIQCGHLGYQNPLYNGYYAVMLTCRRKQSSIEFFLYKTEKTVIKIGQYPSLADLQCAEIGKKYDKVLPKQDLHDLKKAIGLSAHGAGAGSLVYLRRIFENVIWETYKEHQKDLGASGDNFKKKRMDEKVSVLATFLPSQLVEMKSAYVVLSKGIHELSEDECLAYFPVLKLSIELILDQRIEDEIKKQRDKSVKEELDRIIKKIK